MSGIRSELIDEFMERVSDVVSPMIVADPATCKLPPTVTLLDVSMTPAAVVATPIPRPPVMYALPNTLSFCDGDDVPIPTLFVE